MSSVLDLFLATENTGKKKSSRHNKVLAPSATGSREELFESVAAGEGKDSIEAAGNESPELLDELAFPGVDHRVGAEILNESHRVAARRRRQDARLAALRKLHCKSPDGTGGAKNQ